jgi:uncharacterized protein YcfJ
MRILKNKMKTIIPALLATLVISPAMADDDYYDYDTARVISVVPQTERVNNPRQECHTEYIRETYNNNERSLTAPIIGGIAGGLLGSQVGRGGGKVAGAVVGAGVGALVGDQLGNRQQGYQSYSDRPVERCVTVDNWQTLERGYLVKYRYDGRVYSTVTDDDPGDSIRINVAALTGQRFRPGQRVEQIRYIEQGYSQPTRPVVIFSQNSDYHDNWREGRDWHRHHGHEGHDRHED